MIGYMVICENEDGSEYPVKVYLKEYKAECELHRLYVSEENKQRIFKVREIEVITR